MKIYFINLRRSRDRAAALQSHLDELGLSAVRVEAVDGSSLAPGQRASYDPGPRLRRGAAPLTDNEIACFHSHRLVWSAIAGSGRPGVVLEDDVRLAEDAPALFSQAAGHVFYDILRLDGYRKRLALPVGIRWGDRRVHQLCAGPCGSDAYALSARAAAKLLASSERFSEPLDIYLDQFHSHSLAVFAVQPYPVRLNAVFAAQSTIGNSRKVEEDASRRRQGIGGRLRRRWHRTRRSATKILVGLQIAVRWPATVTMIALQAYRDPSRSRLSMIRSPWNGASNSL